MKGITVMVVDDQEDYREVVSEFLSEEGYDVVQAGDGAEALERVKSKKPNLVLLDIALPKVNGYEVCKTLKESPDTSRIPVIFLSARTGLRDRLTAFISGGQRYLSKPLDFTELEKWIQLSLRVGRNAGEKMDIKVVFENLEDIHKKLA